VPKHPLDFREGSSGFGMEGCKGCAETVLGDVAQSELRADPPEGFLAELGAVRFAIHSREYPRADRLRHRVNGRPEPIWDWQNTGLLAFRLAHGVGLVLQIEPFPPHTEDFSLAHPEPDHDPEHDADMRVAGFGVQCCEELGKTRGGNGNAGLLLNAKKLHYKGKLVHMAALDGIPCKGSDQFQGVVRVASRETRLKLTCTDCHHGTCLDPINPRRSEVRLDPPSITTFCCHKVTPAEGGLVDPPPRFPDLVQRGRNLLGEVELTVKKFASFLFQYPAGGREVCRLGGTVGTLPVDLKRVVPEGTNLLESGDVRHCLASVEGARAFGKSRNTVRCTTAAQVPWEVAVAELPHLDKPNTCYY